MSDVVARCIKLGIALALFWALLLSVTRVGCRQTPGREMDPTLTEKSSRVIYKTRYRPGDHIGHDGLILYEHQGADPGRTAYMGRVIGLPGDRIRIDKGEVFRNGQVVNQTYVAAAKRSTDSYEEILVPAASFFVLADNRLDGVRADSRGLGPIGMHAVIGEVRP